MVALLKYAGLGTFGYMFPRILLGAGVPLDEWAKGLGQIISGEAMTSNMAINIVGVLFAIFLITAELWWHPLTKFFVWIKNKIQQNIKKRPERTDDLISLKDAAQSLREETQGTLLAARAEDTWGDEMSPIDYYANRYLKANEGPVYGRKEGLKKRIEIPPEDLLRYSISDDGDSLAEHTENKPMYTDLAITKHDMKKATKKIKLKEIDN